MEKVQQKPIVPAFEPGNFDYLDFMNRGGQPNLVKSKTMFPTDKANMMVDHDGNSIKKGYYSPSKAQMPKVVKCCADELNKKNKVKIEKMEQEFIKLKEKLNQV